MIERGAVTKALQTALVTLTGKPVGIRSVPINPATGKPYLPPYTLLYPLDHSSNDNTVADRHTTAVSDYQATFVSGPRDSRGTDEQAQWLADRARKLIERPAGGAPGYAHALTIPGVTCYRREAREAGGTSDPNDAIITSVIRYRLFLEEQPAA